MTQSHLATKTMLISWIQWKSQDPSDAIPLAILNNYFSIGVDASIALRFHMERTQNPEKFNSRAKNKVMYAQYGASEVFKASYANLNESLRLRVDGHDVSLPVIQGLVFLNITIPNTSVAAEAGIRPRACLSCWGLCDVGRRWPDQPIFSTFSSSSF